MSQFPGGLDTIPTDKVDDTPTHIDHPGHHNLLADAVNKIQSALGINPQGAFPDIRRRLETIEAVASSGSRPFVQDTDPSAGLTAGTEYVWFKMNGNGVLVDILYGKA